MLEHKPRWRAWSDASSGGGGAVTAALQLPLTASGPLQGSGKRGWQFGFGPASGLQSAGSITELCVCGLAPQRLAGVHVLRHGELVYRLDSVRDARGVELAAGELLLAMAQMRGRAALAIDVIGLHLAPASTVVWLRLSDDAGAVVPRVSMRAAPVVPQAAS